MKMGPFTGQAVLIFVLAVTKVSFAYIEVIFTPYLFEKNFFISNNEIKKKTVISLKSGWLASCIGQTCDLSTYKC